MESHRENRSTLILACLFGGEVTAPAGNVPALSDISADGSAPALGAGGRRFESGISDLDYSSDIINKKEMRTWHQRKTS